MTKKEYLKNKVRKWGNVVYRERRELVLTVLKNHPEGLTPIEIRKALLMKLEPEAMRKVLKDLEQRGLIWKRYVTRRHYICYRTIKKRMKRKVGLDG